MVEWSMFILCDAGIVAAALPLAATPANIMVGFKCTGIWPFNPAIFIFAEANFLPAFVTDRPAPVNQPAASSPVGETASCVLSIYNFVKSNNTSPAREPAAAAWDTIEDYDPESCMLSFHEVTISFFHFHFITVLISFLISLSFIL